MPNFQVGQAVRYKQGEGPEPKTPESTGTIKIVVQEPGESGTGENEEPVYQIENPRTGRQASVVQSDVLSVVK